VSALTGNEWNANNGGSAVEMTRPADFESASVRHRLIAVRDTLIVLGMQIVFRTTMFLRHLNY
jgi:hypothetical protein